MKITDARKIHLIFNPFSERFIEAVPYISADIQQGLPDRFWKSHNNRDNFVYEPATGVAEWIPGLNPIPRFLTNIAANLEPKEAFEILFPTWCNWVKETF